MSNARLEYSMINTDGMFLTASPEADINSLIYHTADAGNTWDMTPDTIPGLLHTSLHAPDASTAWVVGYNGKIYKGVLSTVGIKESELTISTRVFPNPTTDIVKVELNGEAIGELNYTLLDVAGRQILSNTVEKQIVSQHFELDLGRLATGIYVLQISNLAGQNYSTRIVKQ